MAADPFVVEPVDDATAVIEVTGHTHGPDADRLASVLERILAEGRTRVIVDLRVAKLVNSKLLDTLVRVSGRLDPRRGEGLAVVTETGYVAHMLEISESGGLIFLEATRDEALEALDGLA